MDVTFCLFENYEILLLLVTAVIRSIASRNAIFVESSLRGEQAKIKSLSNVFLLVKGLTKS